MIQFRIQILLASIVMISSNYFCGCTGVPTYGSAMAIADVPYLVKPYPEDNVQSQTNVSARIGGAFLNTRLFAANDKMLYGDVGIYQSRHFAQYHIAYGGFAYTGNYFIADNDPDDLSKVTWTKKSFYGIQLTAETGITKSFESPFGAQFDSRMMSVRFTLLHENGNYYRYRVRADKDTLILNVHPDHFVFLYTISTEISVKTEVGRLGLCLGNTFYKTNPRRREVFYIHMPWTYFICPYFTHQRTTFYLQIGSSCLEGGLSYAIK